MTDDSLKQQYEKTEVCSEIFPLLSAFGTAIENRWNAYQPFQAITKAYRENPENVTKAIYAAHEHQDALLMFVSKDLQESAPSLPLQRKLRLERLMELLNIPLPPTAEKKKDPVNNNRVEYVTMYI